MVTLTKIQQSFDENTDFCEKSANHVRRVRRLSAHKRRTVAMMDYLGTVPHRFSGAQLRRYRFCHNYLLFRYYPHAQKTKLHDARHCDMHLVCPMCAIRRAARAVQAYERKTAALLAENPSLRLYYAVLTVKNGENLTELFSRLERAMRLLLKRRRDALSFVSGRSARSFYASTSVFSSVSAGAYSFEVKRGANSGLWHPHVNLLLLTDAPLSLEQLRDEWLSVTGDSHVVYCEEKRDRRAAFVEIFKYALKFSDMSFADNYHVWECLRTRRLSGSFGAFRGLDVESEPELDDAAFLEYVEIFYRFNGENYERSERVGVVAPVIEPEKPVVLSSAPIEQVYAAICA